MNQIEIVTAVGTHNPPLSPNIYINRINISYLIKFLFYANGIRKYDNSPLKTVLEFPALVQF